MENLLSLESIDWSEMFSFSMSPVEIVLRGTAMFWFLFLIFRFVVRRDVGAVGIADVLILVIVADAAQNGMSGDYKSISEGMLLVATLIGWNFALDWLSYHFRWFRRFAEPPPIKLIRDGQIMKRNLRLELLSEEELWSQLRQQGIDSLDKVRHVYMESDGQISVIKK